MAAGANILEDSNLGFPFECKSPFLFAVYHKDFYPEGNDKMAPDAGLLRGRNIGQDFGHPSGWSMSEEPAARPASNSAKCEKIAEILQIVAKSAVFEVGAVQRCEILQIVNRKTDSMLHVTLV